MELDKAQVLVDDAALGQYIGQWRRLVSTTNWEKGRIIADWRTAAEARDARISEYSDEAWARLVGGISPQHVGRLRRVHDRFANVQGSYVGLFWSHFFAALEWEDAEMWLEGAVQNHWSVSQMRRQRWETLGGDEPVEVDVIETEIDEDLDVPSSAPTEDDAVRETTSILRTPMDEETELTMPNDEMRDAISPHASMLEAPTTTAIVPEPVRPFADLATLPQDLEDAMESFKVAILRHKLEGWRDVPADAVLQALDALKQLVVSP